MWQRFLFDVHPICTTIVRNPMIIQLVKYFQLFFDDIYYSHYKFWWQNSTGQNPHFITRLIKYFNSHFYFFFPVMSKRVRSKEEAIAHKDGMLSGGRNRGGRKWRAGEIEEVFTVTVMSPSAPPAWGITGQRHSTAQRPTSHKLYSLVSVWI